MTSEALMAALAFLPTARPSASTASWAIEGATTAPAASSGRLEFRRDRPLDSRPEQRSLRFGNQFGRTIDEAAPRPNARRRRRADWGDEAALCPRPRRHISRSRKISRTIRR
jgi:hypothetical protein